VESNAAEVVSEHRLEMIPGADRERSARTECGEAACEVGRYVVAES
jgi:hypothetical protein